ncbi:porin [Salicola sp. Rm-C-2C1-2]|uniref:porin n=1 Tax=Salicola sp. Rm-C-2C1-2 TaxID=3141321 RepID=UPI0032E3B944
MFENNNTTLVSTTGGFRRTTLAAAVSLMIGGMASPAMAELSYETDSGWTFGAGGYIPVFLVGEDEDGGETNIGVGSGFNPASLNLSFSAPTQNGLDVSGHLQINNHVGEGGNNTEGFGSRVAKINVDGDFGTVSIGQGFGLVGTPAIGDTGSAMGVGIMPDQGVDSLATNGRIGAGYKYADFRPRVAYFSPRTGGVQFAVAAIDPDSGTGAFAGTTNQDDDGANNLEEGTKETPRIEYRLDYAGDNVGIWTSGGFQDVDDTGLSGNDSETMYTVDFGGSLSAGNFNARANYSISENTSPVIFTTAPDQEYEQWYAEGTFDAGIHTFGASYGEGEEDNASGANELTMVFSRHRVTDQLTLMVELQDYVGEGGGALMPQREYRALIVGSQFNF